MFYHVKCCFMGNFTRIFSRIRKFCQRYYHLVSLATGSWLGSAKVFAIIGLWNCKMIQLRQKSCQIVILTIFAMRNIHSMTPNVYVFYFDLCRNWGTEKCQHNKKILSTILIGYSCQSVLPEHISNHKIWLRWHVFDYFITYTFGKDWGFQRI